MDACPRCVNLNICADLESEMYQLSHILTEQKTIMESITQLLLSTDKGEHIQGCIPGPVHHTAFSIKVLTDFIVKQHLGPSITIGHYCHYPDRSMCKVHHLKLAWYIWRYTMPAFLRMVPILCFFCREETAVNMGCRISRFYTGISKCTCQSVDNFLLSSTSSNGGSCGVCKVHFANPLPDEGLPTPYSSWRFFDRILEHSRVQQ